MKPGNMQLPAGLVLTMAFIFVFVVSVTAQVQTTTNTTAHPATKEVKVESAQVLYVNGNDLILKMSDGSIRHISNVPVTTHATVDGKEIGIKDVKVGMTLQHTITTTTTPKVITTVQTVRGKIFHVSPPGSIILALENGENQTFKIPKGQKFMVDGEEKDVYQLRRGMMVSATKVVEEPITVVERESKLTGEMPPPPPPTLAVDQPVLIAVMVPSKPPVLAQQARNEPPKTDQELPKSGSELPLLVLLGGLALLGAAGLRLLHRRSGWNSSSANHSL